MTKKYNERNRKINIKTKIKQLFILLILLISFLSFTTSFGRYVLTNIKNFFIRTQEFYFYSDKLTENGSYYQIENWKGVDSYTITINMNSRLNNIKSTTYNINYDISYTCSSNVTCQLSKVNGTISSDSNTDYFNLILSPNTTLEIGDTVWVTIVATSTTNYEKTISGTFSLVVGRENISYEIVDESMQKYLNLNITNTLSYYTVRTAFDDYSVGDTLDVDTYLELSDTDKSKCYSALITLSFDPTVVVLDMTNSNYLNATNVTTQNVSGINYTNGITFEVEPISSTIVRFYKNNVSQNYTYPITNNTSIITVTSN